MYCGTTLLQLIYVFLPKYCQASAFNNAFSGATQQGEKKLKNRPRDLVRYW